MHQVERVTLSDDLLRPRAELGAQLGIVDQPPHRRRERLRVLRRDEQRGVRLDGLLDAGDRRCDHRLAERHRLEQRQRVTFVARRQHDDVDTPQEVAAGRNDHLDVRLPRRLDHLLAVLVGHAGAPSSSFAGRPSIFAACTKTSAPFCGSRRPSSPIRTGPSTLAVGMFSAGTSTPFGITVMRSRGTPASTIASATCCATAMVRACRSTAR